MCFQGYVSQVFLGDAAASSLPGSNGQELGDCTANPSQHETDPLLRPLLLKLPPFTFPCKLHLNILIQQFQTNVASPSGSCSKIIYKGPQKHAFHHTRKVQTCCKGSIFFKCSNQFRLHFLYCGNLKL